jgi:type I restriction enzyme R subunit
VIEAKSQILIQAIPVADRSPAKEEEIVKQIQSELASDAARPFTGELNEYIENVRKTHEQIIDIINVDRVLRSEWDTFTEDKAKDVVKSFQEYIEANKDEVIALSIYYNQPYRRREVTYKMIKELLEKLQLEKPTLAPLYVWDAYAQLEDVRDDSPKSELVALVSLVRRVTGIDQQLTRYDKTVDRNFQTWVFRKQAGPIKFNEDQMSWLRMIKDHVASSFHVEIEDLDFTPFDAQGGRGRMYQLFGDEMTEILNELNEALVA